MTPGISTLALLRLAFSFLTFTALWRQLEVQINSGFSLTNFFSYFTNLANLFTACSFLYGAVHAIAGRAASTPYLQARLISTVNMSVVGSVFAILLRNENLGSLLPWVNFTLHTLMPSVVLLDWFVQPPNRKLRFRQAALCLIFPACYLAYTIVRGANTGWYPYPFLNPALTGSLFAVAGYAAGIAAVFALTSSLLVALGNKLPGKN